MKIKIIGIVSLLLFTALIGCIGTTPQTETYETSFATDGEYNVIFISTELAHNEYLGDSEKRIQQGINDIVSSREYNITKIQTIYRSGFLWRAEIWYLKEENGD